jgi:phosphoglycolate phosphatase-like HAD superfamily hydrolase
MPQPGADTVIPARVRLVLLDCFETLVEQHDWRWRPRIGIPEFLAHFAGRGVPVAVISDADGETLAAAVGQAGLGEAIDRLYDASASEALADGRCRKRLDLPLADYQVAVHESVFIGDSPMDAEAAIHHDLPFIRVPRSEDRAFDFRTLLRGPSRYDSVEFQTAFLRHWQKR